MNGLNRVQRKLAAAGTIAAATAIATGAPATIGASDAWGAGAGATPGAHAARTIALNESGDLHKTGAHHGFHIDEEGAATGTIRGKIYIHLDITSTNRVTAEVNIYPSGGSLSGYGTAAYNTDGGQATFSGTLSISRGTGSYAGAHASGLKFTGTIQRSNDATTVHLSGSLAI